MMLVRCTWALHIFSMGCFFMYCLITDQGFFQQGDKVFAATTNFFLSLRFSTPPSPRLSSAPSWILSFCIFTKVITAVVFRSQILLLLRPPSFFGTASAYCFSVVDLCEKTCFILRGPQVKHVCQTALNWHRAILDVVFFRQNCFFHNATFSCLPKRINISCTFSLVFVAEAYPSASSNTFFLLFGLKFPSVA